MNTTTTTPVYCAPWWTNFWTPFNGLKNNVLLYVCVVGCVTNILNFAVFTRKTMWSPTNAILTGLATTDFLSVFRLLLRLCIFHYGQIYGEWRSAYQLAIEEMIHDILFVLFHTWSIYLTLLIAIWRFFGVMYPLKTRQWYTWRTSKMAISSVILLGLGFVGILFYDRRFTKKIAADTDESPTDRFSTSCRDNEGYDSGSLYELRRSDLGDQIAWYFHGFIIKMLPCFAMTFFSLGLILSLMRAENRRQNLRKPEETHLNDAVENNSKSKSPLLSIHSVVGADPQNEEDGVVELKTKSTRWRKHPVVDPHGNKREGEEFNRTTRMLLVVLALFLLTEFPFGIFGIILVMVDDPNFYFECYVPIRPFFNLNEYISCVTSFFVYLVMSQQFRSTLCLIFGNWWRVCGAKDRPFSEATASFSSARSVQKR